MDSIILLSGKQGSGKSTIMHELGKKAQSSKMKVHTPIFADTIYMIHNYAIGLLEKRGIKRDLVKDGKLLQLLGTEWGRDSIDSDIWVKCLLGQVVEIKERSGEDDENLFIVSDCRFKNEFKIQGVPAFKVRLEASKEVRKARCSQWRENDTHPSEVDLDGYARDGLFDCYVDTEGDLQNSVNHIVKCCNEWRIAGSEAIENTGFSALKEKYYPYQNKCTGRM